MTAKPRSFVHFISQTETILQAVSSIQTNNGAKIMCLKFIYSKKATQFCEISTINLSYVEPVKKHVGDFAKFCGLLRKYEL